MTLKIKRWRSKGSTNLADRLALAWKTTKTPAKKVNKQLPLLKSWDKSFHFDLCSAIKKDEDKLLDFLCVNVCMEDEVGWVTKETTAGGLQILLAPCVLNQDHRISS